MNYAALRLIVAVPFLVLASPLAITAQDGDGARTEAVEPERLGVKSKRRRSKDVLGTFEQIAHLLAASDTGSSVGSRKRGKGRGKGAAQRPAKKPRGAGDGAGRGGKKAASKEVYMISGIGAGGQYMATFPELNIVAIATAHNKGQIGLPLQAILQHLVPLFVK